ncbi:MAG: hypothetical protein WCX77_02840 [Candidatus Paceibacterota bacterium]|jgi:hypothetical protein
MPFITQWKTNVKYLAIVIVVAALAGTGIILYPNKNISPEEKQERPPQSQDIVEEIEGLPSGINILNKNGQKIIINNRDGYQVNIPQNWGDATVEDLSIKEKGEEAITLFEKNTQNWVSIRSFTADSNMSLASWVENDIKNNPTTKYNPYFKILGEENINGNNVYKMVNEDPITGKAYFYYIQVGSKIYEIQSDYSEKSVKDVVSGMNF